METREDSQAAALFKRLMDLWNHTEIEMTGDMDAADIAVFRGPDLAPEGFRITGDGNKIKITGNGRSGVVYGLTSLIKYYGPGGFGAIDVSEAPRLPFRGVQLYMPPKGNIEGFKRVIDMLAYLKHNTLILEVGGGMEYKRHPEINQNWERLCKSINAFPGGPAGFTGSDCYHKDSVHTELGGGSFVPQEDVKTLVDYAKGYGMDVVPELQMLSHAYYITAAYPEYAERREDFFPDTTCPHNEDAYKLYFELAEEVIDVFKPNTVSIGHDEIRVLGLCDTCKNYNGHELLAYEVNRLHDFYSKKNIRIAMWCEKMQSVKNYFTGRTSGGVSDRVNEYGRRWVIPATSDAIKNIPKDVLFLDWLYGWSWDSQAETQANGFKQIFGNFHGEITRGWERRLSSPCVIGGETSSWCLSDEFTLGRDGIIGDFWYSALMLWGAGFDENDHECYMTKMREEMPMLRELLTGGRAASVSAAGQKAAIVYGGSEKPGAYTLPAAALPERGVWKNLSKQCPVEIHGSPAGESAVYFDVGATVKKLF